MQEGGRTMGCCHLWKLKMTVWPLTTTLWVKCLLFLSANRGQNIAGCWGHSQCTSGFAALLFCQLQLSNHNLLIAFLLRDSQSLNMCRRICVRPFTRYLWKEERFRAPSSRISTLRSDWWEFQFPSLIWLDLRLKPSWVGQFQEE